MENGKNSADMFGFSIWGLTAADRKVQPYEGEDLMDFESEIYPGAKLLKVTPTRIFGILPTEKGGNRYRFAKNDPTPAFPEDTRAVLRVVPHGTNEVTWHYLRHDGDVLDLMSLGTVRLESGVPRLYSLDEVMYFGMPEMKRLVW